MAKDKGPGNVRLLYLTQAKHRFTTALAAWGCNIREFTSRKSGSLSGRPCLSSAKPQAQRIAVLGSLRRGLGEAVRCTRGTCYITRYVGSFDFQGSSWFIGRRGMGEFARARFSKHTWRKACLRMPVVVVRTGPSKHSVCSICRRRALAAASAQLAVRQEQE